MCATSRHFCLFIYLESRSFIAQVNSDLAMKLRMNLNFLFFSRLELKVELRVSCVLVQALYPLSSIFSSFFFFENRVTC